MHGGGGIEVHADGDGNGEGAEVGTCAYARQSNTTSKYNTDAVIKIALQIRRVITFTDWATKITLLLACNHSFERY